MGIVLLWVVWAHECMAIFFFIDEHRTWGRFKSYRYMIVINMASITIRWWQLLRKKIRIS